MPENRRLTFAALRSGTVGWISSDLPRAGRHAGTAFAVSWLVNFAVAITKGGAWGHIVGAAAGGNETAGSISIGLLSLIGTALVVYGIESGWGDRRRSFLALPGAAGRMFLEHGFRMWSIVFWGAAVALLSAGAIKPTVAAALALGFLAFAPTGMRGPVDRLDTAPESTGRELASNRPQRRRLDHHHHPPCGLMVRTGVRPPTSGSRRRRR